MTKDDILQAIRLTAMGRAGHPLQEQLAETIAELREAQARFEAALLDTSEPTVVVSGGIEALTYRPEPVKRTRKTKAE